MVNNFLKSPLGHAVASFVLFAGSIALAHLGTWGDVTVGAILTGAFNWFATKVNGTVS